MNILLIIPGLVCLYPYKICIAKKYSLSAYANYKPDKMYISVCRERERERERERKRKKCINLWRSKENNK